MTLSFTRILADTHAEVRLLQRRAGELQSAAEAAPPVPEWTQAFEGAAVTVIAEVKRRSPSAGAIAEIPDPARLAHAYAEGGAGAISVLTNQKHFGGSVADLAAVGEAIGLPILRKDFIVDPIQLYEARAAGASAVLLIARALDATQLLDLVQQAGTLGLGTLVEVHSPRELETAVRVHPSSIGVNSRDLTTFKVDLEAVAPVLRAVPRDVVAVAESGLNTRADVERVAEWGADAVLVGTMLSKHRDPKAGVAQLTGIPRHDRD